MYIVFDLGGSELARDLTWEQAKALLQPQARGTMFVSGTYVLDDQGAVGRIADQDWFERPLPTLEQLASEPIGSSRYGAGGVLR